MLTSRRSARRSRDDLPVRRRDAGAGSRSRDLAALGQVVRSPRPSRRRRTERPVPGAGTGRACTNRAIRAELTTPPRMTRAIGCRISSPGLDPRTAKGTASAARATADAVTGARRSDAACRIVSRRLMPGISASRERSLATRTRLRRVASPNTARNPSIDPSDRSTPSTSPVSSPPTRDSGSVTNTRAARRQLPNNACSSSRTAMAAADGHAEHPGSADFLTGAAGQHLGVVLDRERHLRELLLDVRGDSLDAATLDPGLDVDVPRNGFPVDDGRGRHDAHVGHLVEAHVSAARCVDQHVADALHATSGGRRAPHDDVEHLLLFEDAADLDALQQRRLGATHVTRGEAERLRLLEVDLDLDRRLHVRDRHPARRRHHPHRPSRPGPAPPACAAPSRSWPNTRTASGWSAPVSTSRP